ncbi:hypothetical protein NEOC65_002097 [Neochlamydia sp. AcF65]|nr:hypothetical protein [Neochlamydia sp. AcF65]MBS4170412.1 hypothetical protein [Neochlamydia sp. AcF95]
MAYYSNRNAYAKYFHGEASMKDSISLPEFSVKHVHTYQE